MRSVSKKTAKKHYLPIKKLSKNFQLLYFNKLEEVFRPLGFDNRRMSESRIKLVWIMPSEKEENEVNPMVQRSGIYNPLIKVFNVSSK